MTAHRTADIEVEAPSEDCLAVILDIEAYPGWVAGYRTARVEESDPAGRPTLAVYDVGGFGMSATYRLAYSYAEDPTTVAFEQVDGDLTRSITGRYELHPAGTATRVVYSAAVDAAVPVPRLLRSAVERIIMETALRGLAGEVDRRRRSEEAA